MWTVADVPKYNKSATTRKQKRMWVNVANSALKSCMDGGGSEETCAPKAITQANGVLKKRAEMEAMKNMPNVTEIIKKLNGKSYPASSFLVATDKTKPSTWALPVKTPDGKPDHRLMGAAFAALHSGYRGNKYEGEGKDDAIRKLKAMYKAEDMETPAENAEVEEVAEYGDMDTASYNYVPSGIVSFDQFDAMQDTEHTLHEIQELTNVFTQMVRNIAFWFDGDKIEQLGLVFTQFVNRLDAVINGEEEPEIPEDNSDMTGGELAEFAESESGGLLSINEAKDSNSVLTMEVLIIKPGWGNKVDNHYYDAEMLKQNAHKFVDAKMYETDHREYEKSTRTWVSTIAGIKGFDAYGSPIATVKVHDPGFAERVRNLNALGLLDKMECSIYATGKAAIGFEQDGRKGKNVTELIEVHSVDWVTRAGAGGKAQSLVENQEGGTIMPKDEKDNVTTPAAEVVLPEKPQTETVPVNEQDNPAETQSTPTEQVITDTAAPVEPVYLEQAAVDDVLAKSSLVEIGKYFLAKQKYASLDELNKAIAEAVEKLTAEMGSGKPFGMGGGANSTNSPASVKDVESAVNEVANRVNKQFFNQPRFGG
jgi:hypothetical protein